MGEVLGIGIGDDALRLIAEGKLGVAEECVVGGGNEPTCHLEDRVGGSGLDARGQLLGLRFLFGYSGSDMMTSCRGKFSPSLKAAPN